MKTILLVILIIGPLWAASNDTVSSYTTLDSFMPSRQYLYGIQTNIGKLNQNDDTNVYSLFRATETTYEFISIRHSDLLVT